MLLSSVLRMLPEQQQPNASGEESVLPADESLNTCQVHTTNHNDNDVSIQTTL